jgi:hypothetical protein
MTSYSPELADRIMTEVGARRSMRDICRDDGMPNQSTVFEWIKQDRDGFGTRYRQAREIGWGSPGRVHYTREIADRIIEELMGGRPISRICRDPGMPSLTAVSNWIATDRDGFAARYRAARLVGQLRQAQVGYSAEVTGRIVAGIDCGQPLAEICDEPDMPAVSTVHGWRKQYPEFGARYDEAVQNGCHALAGEILKIVDGRDNDWIQWCDEDGKLHRVLDPERNRRTDTQVRARWKLLARLMPQPYGEPPKAAARPGGGDAYERELAEMRSLINGRSRGLPGEDTPLDDA